MAEDQKTPIVTHDIVYVNSRMGMNGKPYTGRYGRRHFVEGYCGPYPSRGEAKPHVVGTGGQGYADAVAVIGPPEVLEKVKKFVGQLQAEEKKAERAAAKAAREAEKAAAEEAAKAAKGDSDSDPNASSDGDGDTSGDDGGEGGEQLGGDGAAETGEPAGDGETGAEGDSGESKTPPAEGDGEPTENEGQVSEPQSGETEESAGSEDAVGAESTSSETAGNEPTDEIAVPGYHDVRRALAAVSDQFDYLGFTSGATDKASLQEAYREAVRRGVIKS